MAIQKYYFIYSNIQRWLSAQNPYVLILGTAQDVVYPSTGRLREILL
jgi:hypothetical protein